MLYGLLKPPDETSAPTFHDTERMFAVWLFIFAAAAVVHVSISVVLISLMFTILIPGVAAAVVEDSDEESSLQAKTKKLKTSMKIQF